MEPARDPAGALPLAGKVVVVTGRLAGFTRARAEDEIRRLGGTVGGSVTAKTDFLVAGEDAGSKLGRAHALGIPVLREDEFRRLGEGSPAPTPAPAPAAPAPPKKRAS